MGNPGCICSPARDDQYSYFDWSCWRLVNTGLISNIARPEANLTGFVALNVELEEKRLELLKQVVPRLSRVAVLSTLKIS